MLRWRFRALLDKRGLLMAAGAHEESLVFLLTDGPIVLNHHPTKVREAVLIAREVFGEGKGEHAELLDLYARREELECPVPTRQIAWIPHSADGPGLNPGKWIKLEHWLDDQFLMEEALRLQGREPR